MLSKKTVAELKKMAKGLNLKLPAKAKKDEIIAAVISFAARTVKKVKAKETKKVVKQAVKKAIAAVRKPRIVKGEEGIKKTTRIIREEMPAPIPLAAKSGEELVEAAKYYVGEVKEKALPIEKKDELPPFYGENKIVLMARDPYFAFTYWEVTNQRYDDAKRLLGPGVRLVLRIYDITDMPDVKNAHSYFDIDVFDMVGSWYININRPNRSFCIDLGAIAPDGRFLTLIRSNVVTMPRDGVSDVVDEEWMLLEEEFMKLFALSGGYGIGLSTMEIKELIKKRMHLLGIASPSSRWN